MSDDALIVCARAILTLLCGSGRWRLHKEPPMDKFVPISNPLEGLKVGDDVWWYDEDDAQLNSTTVLAVTDGVGYVYYCSYCDGPQLFAVNADGYAKTKKEAVALNREEIQDELVYCDEKVSNMEYLKALLSEA